MQHGFISPEEAMGTGHGFGVIASTHRSVRTRQSTTVGSGRLHRRGEPAHARTRPPQRPQQTLPEQLKFAKSGNHRSTTTVAGGRGGRLTVVFQRWRSATPSLPTRDDVGSILLAAGAVSAAEAEDRSPCLTSSGETVGRGTGCVNCACSDLWGAWGGRNTSSWVYPTFCMELDPNPLPRP